MPLRVQCDGDSFLIAARDVELAEDVELLNRFLAHLRYRNFAVLSRRAYAFDSLNLLRFCSERGVALRGIGPMEVFDYLDWQATRRPGRAGAVVVRLDAGRGVAPATMNRRIAAARGLFEYAVIAGVRADNPVPAARRSSGARVQRGLLGHLGAGRRPTGGRLVPEISSDY
ncbi:MAG: hypothetical protein QOK11_2213 [Pseudonocardiales bacterium]|nr:hypothetical protein [Pseudonocardiales bacterium]